MFDVFITGAVLALIGAFFKRGQEKRMEHIKSGKVYYGVF